MKSFVAVSALCTLLFSCGDEKIYFPDATVATGAKIKFIHAASDAAGVNFYGNNAKISSGASARSTITYSLPFPTTNYVVLAPGSTVIKAVVPSTPEVVLITSTISTETDKYYTIALAGTAAAYETVLISDDVSLIPYDGKAYIRFVNLIHNTSANKVNVIATLEPNPPITIANKVAYKEAVTFMGLTDGAYVIKITDAVTNATIATASTANGTLAINRTYTLFARGQMGGAGGLVLTLDRMINR